MSNINLLIGDKIVENILRGEKDFSFKVDDFERKYVTVDFNGVKSVFGSTFRKDEWPGGIVAIPRRVLFLTAVYSAPSEILLMDPLQSSKPEADTIEDIREQIYPKVVSAAEKLIQSVSANKEDNIEAYRKFINKSSTRKAICKTAWLLALGDFELEDIYPLIELTDREVIYAWLNHDTRKIAERWFFAQNPETIKQGKMIQEAAKVKSSEYKDDPLISLFNILKNNKPTDVINVVTVSYGVEMRHYISHDGLLDSIRNRFEDIPAFGNKANDIVRVYVGEELIWKR